MENEELSKLVWNTHSCRAVPSAIAKAVPSAIAKKSWAMYTSHIQFLPSENLVNLSSTPVADSRTSSHDEPHHLRNPRMCCGPTPTNATAYRSFYVHGDPKQSSIEIALHWIADSLYTLSLWKSYMSYKATNSSSWSKYEQTKSKRIYVHRVVATSQTM